MTAPSERWIQVVVPTAESQAPGDRKENVLLPLHASVSDLLEAMESASSPLYEDVRRRVLQLSGDVLAFGKGRPALLSLRDQLTSGGPVIIPESSHEDGS